MMCGMEWYDVLCGVAWYDVLCGVWCGVVCSDQRK
jgi:hypothetical protein